MTIEVVQTVRNEMGWRKQLPLQLGILIAINYIGSRQNKRWDLTANKQFSLSEQTKNIVAKLDARGSTSSR